jgi:8-oxo-dGTP pyrophosphatase MutT (NUDIX family)
MSDGHLDRLNPGHPTEPRPAAAVVLLRRVGQHESRGLEVLLAKRTPDARFMPNVWVFPGGALPAPTAGVDEEEYRRTAIRELAEEVGVGLADPSGLVLFSRWITPAEVQVRYDTRFYLALAPPHCSPEPDRSEIVDAAWFAPGDALERHSAGEMLLVFPTIKQLEALLVYPTAEEALAGADSHDVEPILPRVVMGGDEPRVLLPGEPGYED